MHATRAGCVIAVVALLGAGCGKKEVTVAEGPGTPAPAAPVDPPRGWSTHENARGGFSLALPRSWSARAAGERTRIRSGDGSLVASVQRDRSAEGRSLEPAAYALTTFAALPGYRDLEGRPDGPPRSPYPVAAYAGTGVRESTGQRQRVSVTAFGRPGAPPLAAVAFSDPAARAERRTLERALATLRLADP